jgi:hypothetical protein
VDHGIYEGKQGCPFFSIRYYAESHADLKGYLPVGKDRDWGPAFDHWLRHGMAEGRCTAPKVKVELEVPPNLIRPGRGDNYLRLRLHAANQDDKPSETTGGRIGFGVGLIIGTMAGDPIDGAVGGTLIGHGLDRVVTAIANDVTGPAWKQLERGALGQALGHVISSPVITVFTKPKWRK